MPGRAHGLATFFVALGVTVFPAGLFAQASSSSPAPSEPEALLRKYCVGCHNDKLKTGGVSLSALRSATVGPQAALWEKVLRKVRTGEMPPVKLPRPDEASHARFLGWLEGELDQAAAHQPNPGAPAIHRLNRAEYSNAVRDLLALDLDHSANLPADDSGYGFDNIASVLTVSPLHMEKYMSSARHISRLAIGTVRPKAAVERYSAPRGSEGGAFDELPLNIRGGILVRHYFPVDAEYTIRVRVRGTPPDKMPHLKLDLRVDGKRIELREAVFDSAEEAQDTRNFEIRLPMTAGEHEVGAGFLNDHLKVEGGPPLGRRGIPVPPPPPVSVDYILIGGPFNITGPGETESRRRIFICRPEPGQPEEPCATKILSVLARRAYRRPVDAADIDPLLKLFAVGRKGGGSFESGIEMGLRAILVSPSFLFRVERDPDGTEPGIHRVSDLELASRLSFFLWSSIPDEELLSLAEKGKLRDQAVLTAQVRRMLADPKANALVGNFAGQWLHLRNVSEWQPDPDKYKAFDDPLRSALERESELFFRYIVREDRSVIDFLDADYTFLNDRLARHYGIKGVQGGYYRRVPLSSPERGGILTQGAILTVTSYPTRTSPVLRGKWILENVLGAPPPPPPPDVPALADTAEGSPKNLREALEKHRANAACASCHARLDPLGFALENYDAIGKFRSHEGGGEIDASGAMPDGSTVRGPGDLKKIMLAHRDEFVECLSEKLLTYALGRGLEYYDLPTVREIRREAAHDDYRFSSLALAIVNSVPFQMRRTPQP